MTHFIQSSSFFPSFPDPKAVLTYWHQVEFFQPYPLQEKIDRHVIRYILYPRQMIDKNLPWLSQDALRLAGGELSKNYVYHLYLGLFDQSELSRLAKSLFSKEEDEEAQIDWEERVMQEGKTCFAKLVLDWEGAPDWNRLSLSTLPWALGKLQRKQQEQIRHKVYEEEVEVLHDYLRRISLKQGERSLILDAYSLMELCQGLFNWAQFFPEHQPLLAVELRERKGSIKEKLLPDLTTQLPALSKEEEGEEPEEPDLGILNSFYIQDLERAIRSYSSENSIEISQKSALEDYLRGNILRSTEGNNDGRIDLASLEGMQEILHYLHPRFSLLGRWPTPSSQSLNLMQQFSLQALFSQLKEGGIYSINGPPGTGKTTLIREIIAENIVRRAKALSSFSSPQKAFISGEKISFGEQKSAWMRTLHPSLLGFEMVIASSNNTAVENLSKELPRKKGIEAEVSYLAPTINKILAPHDRLGQVKPLAEGEKCWGLIAAALGNLGNCRRFLERGFILKTEGESKSYQTIWEWADSYQGISFQEAKEKFLVALQIVEASHALLVDYWDLHLFYSNTSKEDFCRVEKQQYEKAVFLKEELIEKGKEQDKAFLELQEALLYLEKKLDSLEAIKPAWYSFDWRASKAFRDKRETLHRERMAMIDRLAKMREVRRVQEAQLKKAEHVLLVAEKELQEKGEEYEQKKIHYQALSLKVQGVPVPPIKCAQMDKEMHHEGFWQTAEFNQHRSNLFTASMELHEAWLAVVLKKGGGFRGNLVAACHLLSGYSPTSSADTQQIWQSLFMLVPVVSSTFASFSRLFKGISASQLGWLIIDEAGQAIPQAAVGAIWRAKRVVAFGDPFQLEPVITIPPSLVDALGRFHLGGYFAHFSPTLTSVQMLSDAANSLGVYLPGDDERIWVGSPLRVHRRCQDPMFTIANRIAYAEGMVKREERQNMSFSESCWYHLPGKATDRQYVPEQGEFISKQIGDYYEKHKKMPSIYIITPFRRIRSRIASLLLSRPSLKDNLSRRELAQWVSCRIGTVHTFQGKEEEAVFLVLGADPDRRGSVAWASQKPNLLNVAVTRAKFSLYIVGDVVLWGSRPFFETAARLLPIVEVET